MVNTALSELLEGSRLDHYGYNLHEEDFMTFIEHYGMFLHDNDWDYWQPCCYPECDPAEFERKKKEAWELRVTSEDPVISKIQKYRILWIKGRFYPWLSREWRELDQEKYMLWCNFGGNEYMSEWWKSLNK